jgi:hypothetical protein
VQAQKRSIHQARRLAGRFLESRDTCIGYAGVRPGAPNYHFHRNREETREKSRINNTFDLALMPPRTPWMKNYSRILTRKAM